MIGMLAPLPRNGRADLRHWWLKWGLESSSLALLLAAAREGGHGLGGLVHSCWSSMEKHLNT